MMGGQWMVSLLGAILVTSLPCSAFTADRSMDMIPPSGWNIVPHLETERKVAVDNIPPSGRIIVPHLETEKIGIDNTPPNGRINVPHLKTERKVAVDNIPPSGRINVPHLKTERKVTVDNIPPSGRMNVPHLKTERKVAVDNIPMPPIGRINVPHLETEEKVKMDNAPMPPIGRIIVPHLETEKVAVDDIPMPPNGRINVPHLETEEKVTMDNVSMPPNGRINVPHLETERKVKMDNAPMPPIGRIIVPHLETERKIAVDNIPVPFSGWMTVDNFSNGKTPVTNFKAVLQPSDTQKSTQTVEQTVSQDAERDRRDVVLEENDNHFTKTVQLINEETYTVADRMVSSPRNAILLLVTESEQDRQDLWKYYRALHSFPVKGHLQSCHNNKIEGSWFLLDKALVSGSKNKECDCERYLRSNVATLLVWARDVKGMRTETLFNSNFTVPPLFGYEEPVTVPEEIDELDGNMKLNIRQANPEIRSDWYMIDLGKPIVNHASSVQFPPSSRVDDADEPAWNVFDMFTRVRMALFRSLLESLSRNVAGSEESIQFGRSRHSSSNLVEVVRELKSIQNKKGFVLVATTPASELNSAMAALLREVPEDVLVVVSGVCTHDAKPIPFFAKGPAAKMLHEAITIWDLPTTIKNIIANGCQDPSSKNRRQVIKSLPVDQPIIVPEKEDVSKKILQDPEKPVLANGSNTNSTSATEEKKDVSEESLAVIKAGKNFANSDMKATKFTTAFGTISSILVTFMLAS